MAKDDRDFNTILDQCLNTLKLGVSLEAILAHYPEESDRLLPLLKTAQVVTHTPNPKPHKVAAMKSKSRMMRVLAEKRENSQRHKKTIIKDLGLGFRQRRGRGVLIFSLALGFILLSSLCVSAAETVPGCPLYPVKLALQELHRLFIFDLQERGKKTAYYTWVRQQDLLAALEQGRLSEAEVPGTMTAMPTPERNWGPEQ